MNVLLKWRKLKTFLELVEIKLAFQNLWDPRKQSKYGSLPFYVPALKFRSQITWWCLLGHWKVRKKKKCPEQFSPHHTLVIILFSDYVSFSLSALWYITQGPFIHVLSLSVSLCLNKCGGGGGWLVCLLLNVGSGGPNSGSCLHKASILLTE